MTRSVTIPATVTVRQLAEAIGCDPADVGDVLQDRGEPSGPDDVVPGQLAITVADALGFEVALEPRDLTLEWLYAHETRGSPPEVGGRASRLVEGILANLEALDARIEAVSEHWSVSRMPVVDRNVLRIALYELENEPEVPTAVVMSEAVRLAATYSTERSASFVNGVLSALARAAREG